MILRQPNSGAALGGPLVAFGQALQAPPVVWTGGSEFFPGVRVIKFEGPDSQNPLAFRWYEPDREVAGKKMSEWLRFSACYWHTMRGQGSDPFGVPTLKRLWDDGDTDINVACRRVRVFFEFMEKLGIKFFAFHDSDIAPHGKSLAEFNENLDRVIAVMKEEMKRTGIKCLWGTCNLFSEEVFMHGAATSPNLDAFIYAAARVKKMLDIAKELNAEGFVFWGGREGYENLWNTDMAFELENFAKLLHLAVAYKKQIDFKGKFYIEPKPMEPTKHQYDFDAAAVVALLRTHGLFGEVELNLEVNHATLAGHTMRHEMEFAAMHGVLGSLDVNFGDLFLGWDTDKFLTDLATAVEMMLVIIQTGGFTNGGLNFDAKVRRASTDPLDLFYAHIGSMDALARGLLIAEQMHTDGIDLLAAARYSSWQSDIGQKIRSGKATLDELQELMLKQGNPKPCASGREELWETIVQRYLK